MSDEPLTLVSMPYAEAQRLNRLCMKNEPEGVAFEYEVLE